MSRRPSLIGNLLLALAAAVLFVGGLEAAGRLLERVRPAPPAADYIWNWQKKWQGDFYTIRSTGNGWPPWEEFNGDGLRDRTHPPSKPEGVLRVVFLGDSVTLGAETAPAQAYPQVLQARLDDLGRPVEVFNVALWGWSTRQERIAYRTIARRYRPDQVVLAVCLNDLPELQNNLTRPPRFLARLHERSALVRRIVNARGREIRSVEELFEKQDTPKVREAFERFFKEARALRREVEADGAGFSVVVFPFRFQVEPGAPPPHAQERIAAFCAASGIRFLDLLPALRGFGGGAFVDYDHLNPEGARIVADQLMASGLLPEAPSAPEVLRGALRPRDAEAIAAWLGGQEAEGPRTAPILIRLLREGDADVRRAAAWALGRLGGWAPASPLIEALRDESEAVRREAARALSAWGAAGRPAASRLFEALWDERQSVRFEAAQALWKVGLRAEDVRLLIQALESREPYVRGFAAWTLGALGAEAREAVPALVAALEKEEGYGRGGAASALAKMGAAASDAVPALIEGLKSGDGDRRWKAARTLGRIGPEAGAAVPALVQALGDANEHVRINAARALGRIGAKEAIPALVKASRDPDPAVREEAESALAGIRGG